MVIMKTQIEKQSTNRSLANSIIQNKTKLKQALNFVDNRPLSLSLKVNKSNSRVSQLKESWAFNESARRHYKDGWGSKYKITSDQQLKNRIIKEDKWDKGVQRAELDVHTVKGRTSDCYIMYENDYDSNPDGHTYTWHCGPAI